ncbi:MAG TPA: adenylyltransferase/cytidyltransferase family protein [Candidatus Saccharimonadaceae bacterium]|nr:adenylyltransferase/cytidyltransferase family protein [Candidatus Saccharimonadaceae bacterium]
MIVDNKSLSTIKREGNVVYIRGVFDLLHIGHIAFIEAAKKLGDTLVVGIISDYVVRRDKGPGRPIRGELERLRIIDALRNVDYAFIVPVPKHEKTSTEIVFQSLKPDIFVHYHESDEVASFFKQIANQYGVQFILDNSDKLDSTSSTIQKVRK